MTALDEIGTAVDGVSKMLATILPADCGFVLVAFPISGTEGSFRVTRSCNHRLALSARKLREAASNIDLKVEAGG